MQLSGCLAATNAVSVLEQSEDVMGIIYFETVVRDIQAHHKSRYLHAGGTFYPDKRMF